MTYHQYRLSYLADLLSKIVVWDLISEVDCVILRVKEPVVKIDWPCFIPFI